MPQLSSCSDTSAHDQTHPVVLFDGVCNFCNGSVQFLIRQDKKDRLRFAALQSDYAQALLQSMRPDTTSVPDTVLLMEKGILYSHSTAVLRICRLLGRAWPLLYLFIIIPRPLRDAAYKAFARYRYKLFGKQDSCMMPTEAIRRKFIDS